MIVKPFGAGRSVCGTALLLTLLFGATAVWAAEESTEAPVRRKRMVHPLFKSWYTADRNLPVAAYAGGEIRERDLLLFRLMMRKDQVALFDEWENARRAKDRERLTKQLNRSLEELAYMLTLADRQAGRTPRAVDERFIRYLKYPVYQWVWIQRILRPKVKIEDLDLIKYYHDHAGEFYQPESVRVRYILREVDPDALISERRAIEEEMAAIRAKAATGEDFVELARSESDAPSAVRGGELPLVSRGMFVSEFEEAAFALDPGQVSPVFWGPGGLYIVQCLEKLPEQQVPFDEAREEIVEEVEHEAVAFEYDYAALQLIRKHNYRQYVRQFTLLKPDEKILIMPNYELNKQDLLVMFPYIIMEPLALNDLLAEGILMDILRGEKIAQIVEENGLQNDPWLVEADRLARQLWRAQEGMLAQTAVPLTFSEDQVRRYYEENRRALGYQPMWRVLRISATVRNPYLRHPSQLTAMRSVVKQDFEQVIADFRMAFLEERAQTVDGGLIVAEAPLASIDTSMLPEDATTTEGLRLIRRLQKMPRAVQVVNAASTADYEYNVEDLGFLTEKAEKIFWAIKDVPEGGHSRILANSRTGEVYCYFVERILPGRTADYDEIQQHVRRQYIASLQAEAMDRLREDLKTQAALRIRLPELSGEGQ